LCACQNAPTGKFCRLLKAAPRELTKLQHKNYKSLNFSTLNFYKRGAI
jgi:hypothetical protein